MPYLNFFDRAEACWPELTLRSAQAQHGGRNVGNVGTLSN